MIKYTNNYVLAVEDMREVREFVATIKLTVKRYHGPPKVVVLDQFNCWPRLYLARSEFTGLKDA